MKKLYPEDLVVMDNTPVDLLVIEGRERILCRLWVIAVVDTYSHLPLAIMVQPVDQIDWRVILLALLTVGTTETQTDPTPIRLLRNDPEGEEDK